jgi:hypothetical protein
LSRISRTPLDDPSLHHRLQWHASQSLRRGACCSVIVLQPLALKTYSDAVDSATLGDSGPLHDVAQRLRGMLRRTDVVEVDPAAGIGVLLLEADEAGVAAVHARIVCELGQRPSGRVRSGKVEDVRFAIGWASADLVDAVRLPAIVHDLVCIASTPEAWMCIPIIRPARRRADRQVGHAQMGHTVTRRIQPPRPHRHALAPELSAAGTSAEAEALRRKADEQGVPFVRIRNVLSPALRRAISPELARELGAVPIGRTRGVLTVAMRDPSDLSALQRLASATGLTIFPVLADLDDLARALRDIENGAASHRPLAALLG